MFLWLLLLSPLSGACAYFLGQTSNWTFVAAVAAIIPLAEWIRRATEQLAERAGPAIGGLLNVSFGNTAELVLALFVLLSGKADVVKGQITGSLIGNSLLGLGLAVVVGSIGRERQTFKRERASQLSTLLVLSTVALLVPAVFDYAVRQRRVAGAGTIDEQLSLTVSVVLILVYAANLAYTLYTHRDNFSFEPADANGNTHTRPEGGAQPWPVWKALTVLAGATVVTALEAHLASAALDAAASSLGVSAFFLGVVVLAVIGNAAEYLSAVSFARADRLGVAISVTVGSTTQVALLVAPLLVILSWLFGSPMNLVFTPLEVVAVATAAAVVSMIAADGETTWFEGVLLLAVYVLLASAFYLV